ncbi:MAG: phospholipase D family protein [Ferruginibacter sp.]
MSKFITGKELDEEICKVIWEAKETLLIVSPYIKLDDYFKKLFDQHLNNPKVHLVIVFGKNESQVSKSLSKNDFEYFKSFLNISIIYVPNLHAKYYSNESKGIVTSINLYDYSFKNNIEFGIFSENTLLSSLTKNSDHQAWETSWKILQSNEAIFIKRPVYEKKLLSVITGKHYVKSEILHDITSKFYSVEKNRTSSRKITDFPNELELGATSKEMPKREEEIPKIGYCIRTGKRIEFNLKRPYSESAYKSWSQWNNYDYPENYCHKTGKESKGKTSMRNPVL